MSKRTTPPPLTDSICIDANETNNNNNNDHTLTKHAKFSGLPDIFTDVVINGPNGLSNHYFKDGLYRPYSIFDGKFT